MGCNTTWCACIMVAMHFKSSRQRPCPSTSIAGQAAANAQRQTGCNAAEQKKAIAMGSQYAILGGEMAAFKQETHCLIDRLLDGDIKQLLLHLNVLYQRGGTKQEWHPSNILVGSTGYNDGLAAPAVICKIIQHRIQCVGKMAR